MALDTTQRKNNTEGSNSDPDLQRLRRAGWQLAGEFSIGAAADRPSLRAFARNVRALSDHIDKPAQWMSRYSGHDRKWMVDNFRLIRTARREVRGAADAYDNCRLATVPASSDARPLPYYVAAAYLRASMDEFTEEGFLAFLEGFQEAQPLDTAEIWALKPALQTQLLERIGGLQQVSTGGAVLVTSLRRIADSLWKNLVEASSYLNAILLGDPAGAFSRMDFESRDMYRAIVSDLARRATLNEREIAELVLELSRAAGPDRQRHVGYWLLDAGLPLLKHHIAYQPSRRERLRELLLSWPTAFYLIGIELLTMVIVFSILESRGRYEPALLPLLFLIVPATQAAVDFMNNLVTWLTPARILPKLDFSEGLPEDCSTVVAVPVLLLNEKQVRQLVTDLEIRFLANRDPHLRFALLTDCPDSDRQQDDRDSLADLAVELIDGLNVRYGDYFLLFHRHRVYNPSEDRWMGWERKRGKLIDLNQFMRGGYDSFPVRTGDMSVLPRIRYVITLDADTQLPRGTAHRLVGTIAHPLHRAVIDPQTKMVAAGYGILQPRVGISIDSASSSRLASLYSGQTGFDIYTRAVSDVYQDLFGEGSFVGKGIYDVDALRAALDHRFPENALLSHDLIEGAYARAGLVSDVELIDDYPSHFSAYSRRKHRWVRGDWQIMRWLLPRVPDHEGQIITNPISIISRWKILDNLRRSLFEPAALSLFLAGWFLFKGDPARWTAVGLATLLMPVWAQLFFSFLRIPRRPALLRIWARETASTFLKGHLLAFLQVVFLLHQAMLSVDAIARSIMRVFVTRKRLLEWETAAEAENLMRRTATVDMYLAWSPLLALAIAGGLYFANAPALPVAAPVLGLWFAARFLSAWLNRAPRRTSAHLSTEDAQFLRTAALRTWRFFREYSTERNNWLIPDSVRANGTVVERLSPTNLGFLLNAYVAALEFGWITPAEFARSARRTLATYRKLERYRGHILNWYDNESLRTLHPRFVSTVDSGNLLACLWTLKQAALECAASPPPLTRLQQAIRDIEAEAAAETKPGFWTEELAERRREIAEAVDHDAVAAELQAVARECDDLAGEMEFGFLFHRRKKVLSVGCDVDTGLIEPSSYDLLASESRIASFVAIAKGDIPQESWFHLGRKHVLAFGERLLLSWTGTMFEYLMPALWMKHHAGTILQDSMEASVRLQRKAVRHLRLPWGISESGCFEGTEADYGYHPFGVPEAAMKAQEDEAPVISPYSSFLALAVDPQAALANLRALQAQCFGDLGFCEAIDYRSGKPEIVHSWMAHHQGMSLLAVANLLCGEPMRKYFHAEPQVLATELLLHERVPATIVVETEPEPNKLIATAAVAA